MRKRIKNGQTAHPIELRPALDRHVLQGRFGFMLGDKDGNPLWPAPRWTDNTVVTAGRAWVLKHIMSAQSANVSSQIISALALGTGTVAPTTSDTLLGSEIVRQTNITETDNSGSSAPNCVWAVSFATNQGNNASLDEFGLFNTSASTVATLLARATTTASTRGRSMVTWMRKPILIVSNAVMQTRRKLAEIFSALRRDRLSESGPCAEQGYATVGSYGKQNRKRLTEMISHNCFWQLVNRYVSKTTSNTSIWRRLVERLKRELSLMGLNPEMQVAY